MADNGSKRISRRDLLKWSGVVSLNLALSACGRGPKPTDTPTAAPAPTTTPRPTPSRTPAPTTTPRPTPSPTPACLEPLDLAPMPPVRGERYEAEVPDTLDLQERAGLAINALTRCTNPESNYDVYFFGELRRNPPVMYRQMPFPQDVMGKFWEGLALMRYVTGSSFNNHVDQHWRDIFISWFQKTNPLLQGPAGGRLLCWIANNYRIENNPCWKEIAERAMETLSDALRHHEDICYFTDEHGAMQTGWDATYQGWTLQGVTSIYSATGSRVAERLAAGLARYLKDYAKIFDKGGNFVIGPPLHFHHNGNTMVGISEYALAARDQEFAAFAKKGYEFALSTGSPLVGFFPEYIGEGPHRRPYVPNETCCTVDMIMLAINLTKLGQGDYWDDVDRYVRNQFIENQMRNGYWINQIAAKHATKPVGEGEDGDHIAERVVGSFSGWASANDYLASENEPFISGCCTGNGARALFYVWENMITFDAGRLKLHLLLNRASPWADVNSYVPYEGRVDLKMKVACDLEVRIPEWVKPDEVSGLVNDEPRPLAFQGRYALIGSVEPEDLVTVTFPIFERTVDTIIGNVPYTLIIKGNDVVSINPPGKWHPFYQRAKYRENQVRWVTRERFVPAI